MDPPFTRAEFEFGGRGALALVMHGVFFWMGIVECKCASDTQI